MNRARFHCALGSLLLLALRLQAAPAPGKPLWQVGRPDGRNAEFALAPRDFHQIKSDGFFVVGTSTAEQTWPYVHPGPADGWAGGRPHTFFVLFGLEKAPQQGKCVLTLDLLDTQGKVPPKIRIKLNAVALERQLPPGAGDHTVNGEFTKGKKQHLSFAFPATALQAGDNRIEITTLSGSWLIYDALAFEAPGQLRLTPTALTFLDSIQAPQALVRRAGEELQPLTVSIQHFGPPAPATVRLSDGATTHTTLATGTNSIALLLKPVECATTVTVTIEAGGKPLATQAVGLRPVRHWTVYILPHSHVDIGYTAVQTEIEKQQMENIDLAIEIARATAGNLEGERYKWNVEVLWGVESYLKQGPEKEKKLLEAIKAGQLELQGYYCNILSALCRPEELVRLVRYATELRERFGVPVEGAMISDVPGLTWGIVPVMAKAGIRYLSEGPNRHDRVGGARLTWEDKPFWWASPSGKERVLCWTSYMGYSPFHGRFTLEGDVVNRLGELETQGYPYDITYLRWSKGDNGPPRPEIVDEVRAWNATHAWPKVRLATMGEAFGAFEKKYGDKLPTYSGDFTPYWEDGAASSARETGLNRASAERLAQAEALFALLNPKAYPAGEFWTAWRNVLLYSEHTWGANISIRDPDAEFTKAQWKIKQAFALDGENQSAKLLHAAKGLRPAAPSRPARIDVFNTSSWSRTEVVFVDQALSDGGNIVREGESQQGPEAPSQRLSGKLAFLAKDVPPFGAKRYTIFPGKAKGVGAARAEGNMLTNGPLTVKVDGRTGAIAELRMKGIEGNLVDAKSAAGMNAYFYLPGSDLAGLQRPAGPVKIKVGERGPLVASLTIESDAPGGNGLRRTLRLIDGMDRLEITNTVDKKAIREKEGVHFGFGFNVPEGQVRLDLAWSVIRPEADQIPGSCKNWFTVQRWVDISNASHGVTWAPLDAPLVELGAITANLLGAQADPAGWRQHVEPTQTLYSWAMNNHWHTNYLAEQSGPTPFRYVIRPHAGTYDAAREARYGVECSQPLIVLPALDGPVAGTPRLRIESENSGVLAGALKPADDGKALIVRLYNVTDKAARATLRFADPQPAAVTLSNLTEKAGAKISDGVEVPAHDFVTLRAE